MDRFFDDDIARPSSVEWLTVFLIAAVYCGLGLLMWFYQALPFWMIMLVAGYLIALHGSLQHEILHGHPTRNSMVNELLVTISPSLWYPYRRYRKLHLTHHNDANLTDPRRDPESFYLLPEVWAEMPAPLKQIYMLNNTLAGRMIIGPWVSGINFWRGDCKAIVAGDRDIINAWVWHIPAVAITLVFAILICDIPLWAYLVMFVWPGIAFSLIRSFCEHRAVAAVEARTIIVESSPPLSLMFLNNNLHVAHHRMPRMAWYKIPRYYRAQRDEILRSNQHYLMHGYREIFRRFFFSAKEPVAYPDMTYLKP